MKKRKMLKIIASVWLILICSWIYLYRFDLLKFMNEHFYKGETKIELTTEQKIEDFEAFYTTMVESVPYLEQKKALYGIDFVARKDYYLNEVKATKNNLEYYGVMKAIAADLNSFHTDICFPMYSNLLGLNCYNSEKVVQGLGRKEKIDAWWQEIEEGLQEYEDVDLVKVVYIDGKYVVENDCLPQGCSELENYELDQIDGEDAGQYIVEHISIFDLQYDYIHKQAYRGGCVLNDKVGKEVQVVWKNEAGQKIHQTLFMNNGAEVVWSYGYLFSEKYDYYHMEELQEEDVVMQRDDENQLEYVKINNFGNANGDQLKEYLLNTPYQTIVIDLRDNYGGLNNYAVKYLYPGLYDEDVIFSYFWKVPNTKSNKKMSNSLGVRFSYYDRKDKDFIYYKDTLRYKGEQTDKKEVYYLIGSDTGSAADTYMAMVKEKHLGTIVGTNTGGEGLGASFICDTLKNSGLVYVYYPSISIDEDGREDRCAGVAPDIYVGQSKSDFEMEKNLRDYSQKLEYDAVLSWVVNQLK